MTCVDRATLPQRFVSKIRRALQKVALLSPQDCLLSREARPFGGDSPLYDSAQWSVESAQFEFRQDDNLTRSADSHATRFAQGVLRGFATVRLPHAGTRPLGPARLPSGPFHVFSRVYSELGGRRGHRTSLYPPSRRHRSRITMTRSTYNQYAIARHVTPYDVSVVARAQTVCVSFLDNESTFR